MKDYPVLGEGKGIHSPPEYSWYGKDAHKRWLDEYLNRPALFNLEPFDDGDVDYFAVKPRCPWQSLEFLERHFECVSQAPIPLLVTYCVTADTAGPHKVRCYRLASQPLIVAVAVLRSGLVADCLFYRVVWRLFWRKIDPETDPRLREILQGALSLDALAGRGP